jgi:hypothetical protein
VTFYPQRWLWATELRAGRLAFWNPYVAEGTFLLPVFYPLDILHAVWPGPAAVSWLLTLHFPLAALAAYALARELGVDRLGSVVSGAVFSMGGFALSCLNLYVFLQALALAPLVVLATRRAALVGGPWIAAAAAALAVAMTTLAVEFVVQAWLLGALLGWAAGRRGLGRLVLAGVLGLGLAAVPIGTTLGILKESVRGAGFASDVALANEMHPATVVQALVPNAFGALSSPVESWWGRRFFTKGFPYFLSCYVGPLTLGLAVAGLRGGSRRQALLLLGVGLLGVWYALGTRGGLAPLALQIVPGAASFRFPSKALLLPFLVLSLLAGRGMAALAAGHGVTAFRRALLATASLGIVLGGLILFAPWTLEAVTGEVWAPGSVPARLVGVDCLWLASLSLLGIGLAGRMAPGGRPALRAAVLLAILLAADLLRAGAGMNPQITPAFFAPLPELARLGLDRLEGGRVFTYGLDGSPAFRSFLATQHGGVALWSFFVSRQMEVPYANVLDRVELAEGKDLTSFVPQPAVLALEDYDPRLVGRIVPRLHEAAVGRVLSLDPLADPALRLLGRVDSGAPGLVIHVYALEGSAPRDAVACPAAAPACQGTVRRVAAGTGRIELDVDAGGPAIVVVRESFASGWRATVNGRPETVQRVLGRYRGVVVPQGHSRLVLEYHPPGLALGAAITAVAAVATAMLAWRGRRPRTAGDA